MDAHEKVTPSVIWSIVGTAGVACSGVLVETSMNVTFPTLMKVFNQSLNNVQWITTAYLLAVTLTIVLAAYLQRSFKFKSLIIAAGTASVIGGAICMLANSLPVMLLGRIIQGIGTGIAPALLNHHAGGSAGQAGFFCRDRGDDHRLGAVTRANLRGDLPVRPQLALQLYFYPANHHYLLHHRGLLHE